MSEALYEIAFQGELIAGADREHTRQNLMRLFQADEARIDALFSGRRVVIKNRLDAATAERYRATLAQAGAQVDVLPMAEVAPVPTPAPAVAVAVASRQAPASLQAVPRDVVMAAFVDVEAPDFGLAPVGADLQDETRKPTPVAVDTAHLSLAPAGSDLGQLPGAPPVMVPDTDHLSLAKD